MFSNDACIELLRDFDDNASSTIVSRLLIVIDFADDEDSNC